MKKTSAFAEFLPVAVSAFWLLTNMSVHAQGATPVRIMCIGDGITVGYTDNPNWTIPFEFGYRSGLYSRLVTNGYTIQFVGNSPEPWNGNFGLPTNTPSPDLRTVDQDHHHGYAGLSTAGALGNIGPWLAAENPAVVLLTVGTDDTDIPTATSNVTSIVQTIVTNSLADVIVAQIPPSINYSQFVVDYNSFIRGTLVPAYEAYGKRVSTVDQYSNFLTNGSIDPALFSTGLHPGNLAYGRMAQTWYAGILAVHPPSFQVSFTSAKLLAGNIILTGTGGPANGSFFMLSATNPALPLSSWSTNTDKGAFDSAGNFSYTSAVPSSVLNQFFRLELQ